MNDLNKICQIINNIFDNADSNETADGKVIDALVLKNGARLHFSKIWNDNEKCWMIIVEVFDYQNNHWESYEIEYDDDGTITALARKILKDAEFLGEVV